MPDQVLRRLSDRMPEDMSDSMPGRIPDKMSEEYVGVGITQSKTYSEFPIFLTLCATSGYNEALLKSKRHQLHESPKGLTPVWTKILTDSFPYIGNVLPVMNLPLTF